MCKMTVYSDLGYFSKFAAFLKMYLIIFVNTFNRCFRVVFGCFCSKGDTPIWGMLPVIIHLQHGLQLVANASLLEKLLTSELI